MQAALRVLAECEEKHADLMLEQEQEHQQEEEGEVEQQP